MNLSQILQNDMTHFEQYNQIIDFRKSNPLPKDQYGENHHIVPRSVCPILKDSPDNIVRLSAQEHFLAHYHIWLAYRDELHEKKWTKSMCFAISQMKRLLTKCNNIGLLARLYDEAKSEMAKIQSQSKKGKHLSLETRKKMSASQKGKKRNNITKKRMALAQQKYYASPASIETRKKIGNANRGRKHTLEYKKKMWVPVCQYTKDGKFVAEYESIKEAEKQTGALHNNISKVCKGKRPFAGGFRWNYKKRV